MWRYSVLGLTCYIDDIDIVHWLLVVLLVNKLLQSWFGLKHVNWAVLAWDNLHNFRQTSQKFTIYYNILDLREKKMKVSFIYSISKWYGKWLKRMSEMQIMYRKQAFPKWVKNMSESSVHQGHVVAHTFILYLNAFLFLKLSYKFKFLV